MPAVAKVFNGVQDTRAGRTEGGLMFSIRGTPLFCVRRAGARAGIFCGQFIGSASWRGRIASSRLFPQQYLLIG